jgi:hypothetical protein
VQRIFEMSEYKTHINLTQRYLLIFIDLIISVVLNIDHAWFWACSLIIPCSLSFCKQTIGFDLTLTVIGMFTIHCMQSASLKVQPTHKSWIQRRGPKLDIPCCALLARQVRAHDARGLHDASCTSYANFARNICVTDICPDSLRISMYLHGSMRNINYIVGSYITVAVLVFRNIAILISPTP